MATQPDVVLVDVNPQVTGAWELAFAGEPGVRVVRGSILAERTDAWVTPTNALGRMDGGVDAAVNRHFGGRIQKLVRSEIRRKFDGHLPVGSATCLPTGGVQPRFLLSTPTMVASAEDVSGTLNVALACAAAFQAVHLQNAAEPGSVRSVAIPGLGAATGRVPPRVCANLMWAGYTLFREYAFRDYDALRAAVRAHFDDEPVVSEEQKVKIVVPAELVSEPYILGKGW